MSLSVAVNTSRQGRIILKIKYISAEGARLQRGAKIRGYLDDTQKSGNGARKKWGA